MAGEIIKTRGIVLAIHPWSRTSHVVVWLTPDHGVVSTLVKGAVRPKSAFLGQYDLFYACDLLYYARAAGDLHALREVTPLNLREHLRSRWRETALAGYAAQLIRDLAPPGVEADAWYTFLDTFLESLGQSSVFSLQSSGFNLQDSKVNLLVSMPLSAVVAAQDGDINTQPANRPTGQPANSSLKTSTLRASAPPRDTSSPSPIPNPQSPVPNILLRKLVTLEMEILRLAGLSPDFSGMNPHAAWTSFSVDLGRCGEGTRTLRLSPRTVMALQRPDAAATSPDALSDAVRFLGLFLSFHLEQAPDTRRTLVALLARPPSDNPLPH